MEKLYKIGKSKIEGLGLIATENLQAGDLIGMSHSNGQPSSEIGQYYNHSDTPNAVSEMIGSDRYVIISSPIKKGDEITLDYRKQPELEQPEDFDFEAPERKGVRSNADGSESTHLMRTETIDGINWISFPTLFENPDGTWLDMSDEENWKIPMMEAEKRGEIIHFGPNKQAALEFGKGSWKPEEESIMQKEKTIPMLQDGGDPYMPMMRRVDDWYKKYVTSDKFKELLKKGNYPGASNPYDLWRNYIKDEEQGFSLGPGEQVDVNVGYQTASLSPGHNMWERNDRGFWDSYLDPGNASIFNLFSLNDFEPEDRTLRYDPEWLKNFSSIWKNVDPEQVLAHEYGHFGHIHDNKGLHMPGTVGSFMSQEMYDEILNRQIATKTGKHPDHPAWELEQDEAWNRLSEEERKLQLENHKSKEEWFKHRIKHKREHDVMPYETRADIMGLRYMLDKHGIYKVEDTRDFNMDDLNKIFEKEGVDKRLLRLYDKKDIVWLMNNVAFNEEIGDDLPDDLMRAQRGLFIKPKAKTKLRYDITPTNIFHTAYYNHPIYKAHVKNRAHHHHRDFNEAIKGYSNEFQWGPISEDKFDSWMKPDRLDQRFPWENFKTGDIPLNKYRWLPDDDMLDWYRHHGIDEGHPAFHKGPVEGNIYQMFPWMQREVGTPTMLLDHKNIPIMTYGDVYKYDRNLKNFIAKNLLSGGSAYPTSHAIFDLDGKLIGREWPTSVRESENAATFLLDDSGFTNHSLTPYITMNNNPLIAKDDFLSTIVHERGHIMDASGTRHPIIDQMKFRFAMDPNYNTTIGKLSEKIGLNVGAGNMNLFNLKKYYQEPTEQYARMMEERYRLGLMPGDRYTYDMFRSNPKMHGMGKYLKYNDYGAGDHVPVNFIKNMNTIWQEGGEPKQLTNEEILDINKDVDAWNKEYVQSANFTNMLKRSKTKPNVIDYRIQSVLNFNPDTDITFDTDNPSLGTAYDPFYINSAGNPTWNQGPFGGEKQLINYNPSLMLDHGMYGNIGLAESGWPGVSAHEHGHIGTVGMLNRKTRKALKSILDPEALYKTKKENKDAWKHAKDPEEMRANLLQLRYQLDRAGIYDSKKGLAVNEDGEEGDNPFTWEHLKQIIDWNEDDSFNRFKPEFMNELFPYVGPEDLIWMMNNIAMDNVGDELPDGVVRAQDGTEINYSDYKYIPQEFFQVPEGEFEYDAGYWDKEAKQWVPNMQTTSIDPAWFTPGFEDSDVYKNYTRDQKRAYANNPYTVYSDDGMIHPLLWDKERLAKENKLRFNAQLLAQIYDEEGNVRPEYQDRIGDKRYLTSTDTPYWDIPEHGAFSSDISNKDNWYSELKPNIYTEDGTVTGYLWNEDKGKFVRTADVTYDQLVDQYKHIKHLPGMKGISKRKYKKRLQEGDIFWPQMHSDEQYQGFEDQYSSVMHPIKPEDVELQKDFFNNAISGDLYRQKLINAGYENVDEIIEKRRKGLLDTEVRYDSESDSWKDEASASDDPNVYHKILDKMNLLGELYKEAGIPFNKLNDLMYMSGDYTRIGDERSEIDQDYSKREERRKSGQSYYTEPEWKQMLYAQLGHLDSPMMKRAMRKILSGHLGSRAYTGSHGANFGEVALDPRQAQGINIDMGFEGTPAQLKSQMSSVTAHELAHMMGASHNDSDFGLNEHDQNYIADRMNVSEDANSHDKSVFERKADLDAMRLDMMETIGYDYGKDMLTPEILEEYKQHIINNPNPNLSRDRMFKFFDDQDIIDINNAVAMEEFDLDVAQRGGETTKQIIRRILSKPKRAYDLRKYNISKDAFGLSGRDLSGHVSYPVTRSSAITDFRSANNLWDWDDETIDLMREYTIDSSPFKRATFSEDGGLSFPLSTFKDEFGNPINVSDDSYAIMLGNKINDQRITWPFDRPLSLTRNFNETPTLSGTHGNIDDLINKLKTGEVFQLGEITSWALGKSSLPNFGEHRYIIKDFDYLNTPALLNEYKDLTHNQSKVWKEREILLNNPHFRVTNIIKNAPRPSHFSLRTKLTGDDVPLLKGVTRNKHGAIEFVKDMSMPIHIGGQPNKYYDDFIKITELDPNYKWEPIPNYGTDIELEIVPPSKLTGYKKGGSVKTKKKSKYHKSPFGDSKISLVDPSILINQLIDQGIFTSEFKYGGEKRISTGYNIKKEFDDSKDIPFISYTSEPNVEGRIYYDKDSESGLDNFNLINIEEELVRKQNKHKRTKDIILKYENGQELSHTERSYLNSLGLLD